MTRLLKTPIIGRSAAPVASSCSDMLAGLSKNEILRTPPAFCAWAGCAARRRASNGPAVANIPKRGCITPSSRRFQYAPCLSVIASAAKQSRGPSPVDRACFVATLLAMTTQLGALLFVEPDVFEAPAIVDAVDHDRQTLDPGLPAGAAGRVKDDRSDRSFRQHPFELPDDLLALFRIGLHRLLIDELVELRVAVAGIVPCGAADEILVEHLIRVIDAGLHRHGANRVVFAHDLRVPLGGIDDVELGVDIDLLQLRAEEHGRIAPGRNV